MRMVRHAMDRQKLLLPFSDDTRQIFMQFFFVFPANQILPPFYGENDLKVICE